MIFQGKDYKGSLTPSEELDCIQEAGIVLETELDDAHRKHYVHCLPILLLLHPYDDFSHQSYHPATHLPFFTKPKD